MYPDKWLVLTVRVPSEAQGEAFAETLIALGGGAVEEHDDRLTTYLMPPDDPDAFLRDARDRLAGLAPGQDLELNWRWQENEDWAEKWRRGLGPRRVGRRLIVAPTWTEPRPAPDEWVIWIDPQMAFGTGEHATTRGVLRLLEGSVLAGDRVLDVGTGSGILAIAAAKLGAAGVVAVESDPDALINARENVERNDVAGRVELTEGLVDPAWLEERGAGRFDLIVANVLSGILIPLLPAFRWVLVDGTAGGRRGRLILGGILDREEDRVVEAAGRAGFRLVCADTEEEWWSGLFEVVDSAEGGAARGGSVA